MIDKLVVYIKKHKRLFLLIKSNEFLMWCIEYILQLRFIVTRGGLVLVWKFIYHTIRYYVFRIREDIQIIVKGVAIAMPNHMKALDGVIEVMCDEFYDKSILVG